MAKKSIFYFVYFLFGAILSYFLPENSRYTLGFCMAMLSAWAWRVLSKEQPKKEFIGCTCPQEIKPGQTQISCCNICGKPDEEFWTGKKEQEVQHG